MKFKSLSTLLAICCAFSALAGEFDNHSPTKWTKEKIQNLKVHLPEWGQDSTKFKPIIVQDGHTRVILTVTHEGLKLVDLDTEKTLWKINVPVITFAHPVYSARKKMFYFLTRTHHEENKQNIFQLFAINRSGEIKDRKEFDLMKIYEKLGVKLDLSDMAQVYCKTSLGLNEINKDHYIYFGCSVPRDPERNLPYGHRRGLTGLFLGFYIKKENGFFDQKKNPLVFNPSIITEDPYTGFNSGIFMAGGKAPLLKENLILIATGNGPALPLKGNFGCSLVLLDGKNFKPVKKYPHFMTQDDPDTSECFHSNTDLSSSAPVIAESGLIGSAKDKLGNVYFYNPLKLPAQASKAVVIEPRKTFGINGMPSYGGGAFFKSNNKIIAISLIGSRRNYRSYLAYTTREHGRYYTQKGYVENKCIGLIKKNGQKQQLLANYYSGDVMRYSIVANENHRHELEERKFVYNAAIKNIVKTAISDYKVPLILRHYIGYGLEKNETVPPGFSLQPLKVHLSLRTKLNPAVEEYQNEFGQVSSYKETKNLYPLFSTENYILLKNTSNNECPSYDSNKYVALYEYELKIKSDVGYVLMAHEFNSEKELLPRLLWKSEGKSKYEPARASIHVLFSQQSGQRFVVFNTVNMENQERHLNIIDASSGELLRQIALPGSLHFSSFTPTLESLILTTAEKGLIMIK